MEYSNIPQLRLSHSYIFEYAYTPFKAYLLTVCVSSQTEREPQGGEEANAELDG